MKQSDQVRNADSVIEQHDETRESHSQTMYHKKDALTKKCELNLLNLKKN